VSRAQIDPRLTAEWPDGAVAPEPPPHSSSVFSVTKAAVRAMRPRQWVKNVLVFAAPAAAGVITHSRVLGHTVIAFGLFVAASASTYLVNDVIDAENDRVHPVKCHRPIAAGQLAPRIAIAMAVVLGVGAVVVSAILIDAALAGIVATYLAISMAYSFGLKRVALLELACVGSGFALRAVAGGAAAGVRISPWFLLVASFGALFIVAGKRSVEQRVMGEDGASHRVTLAQYPVGFLKSVRTLAMSVTVTTYCLWAFERAAGLAPADRAEDMVWFELSIVPFVLAVLFVELAIERGRGGEPEELAMTDHVLQALGALWLGLLLCGIYA
jgi:decaprenyl-phosphate phosphoribosyltransferase